MFQQLAQTVAGSFDSHFQRGDAGACQFRHLLVAELFDVLEDERLALLGVEAVERTLDLFDLARRLRTRHNRRRFHRLRVAYQAALPTITAHRQRATFVDDYLLQPGPKSRRVPAFTKLAKRSNEGALERIVGVVTAAEHPQREPETGVLIPPQQAGEGLYVAPEDGCYELSIETVIHSEQTTALTHSVTIPIAICPQAAFYGRVRSLRRRLAL